MDKFYHFIVGFIIFKVLTKYFEMDYRKAVLYIFSLALCKEIYDHISYDASVIGSIKDIFFTMVGCL